jgi:hypothetical protein
MLVLDFVMPWTNMLCYVMRKATKKPNKQINKQQKEPTSKRKQNFKKNDNFINKTKQKQQLHKQNFKKRQLHKQNKT